MVYIVESQQVKQQNNVYIQILILKVVRETKGVLRYELAKKSGLNYYTILAIETGGDVKFSTLQRIADVLQVKVKDLFKQR